MTDSIDIHPHDWETVQAILDKHVSDPEVRAFGSWVQGTARKTSAFDLVVMTDKPLYEHEKWTEAGYNPHKPRRPRTPIVF